MGYIGKIETRTVYEQPIVVRDETGQEHSFRRIRVKLKQQTRDGDTEIFIIASHGLRIGTGLRYEQ